MTVKLHVFLSTCSLKNNKVIIEPRDIIVCGKGMSSHFSQSTQVFELGGVSCESKLRFFADSFHTEFTKGFSSEDIACYSQFNDVFKFILFDLFEITTIIKKIKPKTVFLYDGCSKIDFISIYLASNTEVSRPLFSSRARIINPLLSSWLSSIEAIKLTWHQENQYKLRLVKFIRNTLIFSLSLITTISSLRKKNAQNSAKNLVVYRSEDQYENMLSLGKLLPDTQFIQGPSITKQNGHSDASLISLKVLLFALIDTARAKLKEVYSKQDCLIIQLNGGILRIKKKSIMNEANCLVTSFAYYRGLKDLLERNSHIRKVFTSEMSSRYAVIEKVVTEGRSVSLIGLQFISIGNIVLPKFPLQKHLLTKSRSDYKILKSLYPSGAFCYVGNFLLTTKFADIENLKIEKSIIFYSQPYNIEDNIEIVKIILKTLPVDWKFYIRNHPRDSFNYSSISERIYIDSNKYYFDVFASSSIVVSKSSSILVDSIEMGKVTIPVAFDSYTRSILSAVIGPDIRAVLEPRELKSVLWNSFQMNVQIPDFNFASDVFVSKEKLQSVISS